MGLFNFKLGGSKKEQDKPIRDKLKDKKYGLMVKCTPERGHNALFFIPLQVFIML